MNFPAFRGYIHTVTCVDLNYPMQPDGWELGRVCSCHRVFRDSARARYPSATQSICHHVLNRHRTLCRCHLRDRQRSWVTADLYHLSHSVSRHGCRRAHARRRRFSPCLPMAPPFSVFSEPSIGVWPCVIGSIRRPQCWPGGLCRVCWPGLHSCGVQAAACGCWRPDCGPVGPWIVPYIPDSA